MWGKTSAVLGTVAVAVFTVSCSDRGSGGEPEPSPVPVATFGAFYGECGSVTDEDVVAATGLSALSLVAANGIKCRWEAPGGRPYAMFTWYRGSPIDRERLGTELSGRDVEQIQVDGRRAYTSRITDSSACEVGVEDNDDFIYWLVNYDGTTPPDDWCVAPLDLARLTLSRTP